MRRTKIVCTIGPASRSPEALEQLIQAGMNVARLNFSHGTQDEHAENIRNIRAIAEKLHRPIAILQDIAGPKIRVGEIADDTITLETGRTFTLTSRDVPGNAEEVSLTYKELPQEVKEGDALLLSDGALELKVIGASDQDITCEVVIGGPLSSHKGINLPTGSVNAPILSAKDESDLAFGLEQDVDYVAISFVRSADDVARVRSFITSKGYDVPLIAKIEKHEALSQLDEIIANVEGIMVARGDLGVEIPIEQVPRVQKDLIAKANETNKLVITATQMLRSMVDSPRPTRAEVTDVANAILDGTDAVMLSEETAVGAYPVRAVKMMSRIASDTESFFPFHAWTQKFHQKGISLSSEEAVAHAACRLAEDLHASAILTCTTSGSTARLVCKNRPAPIIVAPTPQEKTCRQLALAWGTEPLMIPVVENTDDMFHIACGAAVEAGLINSGDTVVITAGVPMNTVGATNVIRVIKACPTVNP